MKFNSTAYFKDQILKCVQIIEDIDGTELIKSRPKLDERIEVVMFSEDALTVKHLYRELAELIDLIRGSEG
jgi:hypothetical protein